MYDVLFAVYVLVQGYSSESTASPYSVPSLLLFGAVLVPTYSNR